MARPHHILLVSLVVALLAGFAWNTKSSEAHPSGHSHQHIFSSHSKHNPGGDASKKEKFYCPMHKHSSSLPCPHAHTQKEMAHPKRCKIGPECGGGSTKSVPGSPGTNHNPGPNDGALSLDPPAITQAPFSQGLTHNTPHPDLPWHPPQSL